MNVPKKRVVDGIPNHKHDLRDIEPVIGDLVLDKKHFDVVELEDGVDESGGESGGGVGERRQVNPTSTNTKHFFFH